MKGTGARNERTALVVERGEVVEQLERTHDRLGRGRVHVVKVHEVVDAELLELEDDGREVAPQNLGVGLLLELWAGCADRKSVV